MPKYPILCQKILQIQYLLQNKFKFVYHKFKNKKIKNIFYLFYNIIKIYVLKIYKILFM